MLYNLYNYYFLSEVSLSMRIEQFLYLIEISKNSSLNQSSKKLHISYQGLNNAINSLENELGYPVLVRSPKGVTLTAKGKVLVQAASTFLQTLSSLSEKTTANIPPINLPADYTLHSTYSAVHTILPELLSYLYNNFPQTNFSLKQHSAEECIQSIRNNKIPFAICDRCIFNDTVITDDFFSNVSFIPFESNNKLFAIIPSKFPLSDLKQVSLFHLLKYPLIIQYETSPEYSLKRLLDYLNAQPQKLILESNWQIIQQLLLANIGILLAIDIPTFFSSSNNATQLKIVPISDSITIQSGYLFHNMQSLSPYDSYILNDFATKKSQK